jgi:hypothetical protein
MAGAEGGFSDEAPFEADDDAWRAERVAYRKKTKKMWKK